MRYLSIFLLSILFFSCAKEEDASRVDKEVTFYPIYSTTNTRANEIVSFVDGDAVGIYVLDKSTNKALKPTGNYADNKRYIWSSEKKSFIAADNSNLIFNSPDRKLEFYVYFPYYNQVVDATSLSHVIGGSGREDDFLLAINSDMNGAQSVPLSFKHLLSKVEVKYTSPENRENAQMTVNTYTDTKINLSTGSISTIANKRVEIPLEKITFPDYLSFIGVVAPQIYKAGDKFGMLTYTAGASHPFSFPSDRTFVSGQLNEVSFMPKSKAYTFSVTPDILSVSPTDNAIYPLSVISQKDDAINGVNLPGTTIAVNYQLSAKPDWVTVNGTNVLFSENRGAARDGVITFTQDESALTSSVSVQQAAGVMTTNYIFAISGGTSSASWTGIVPTGDSRNYSIISNKQVLVNGVLESSENIAYTGSSDVDWITVSGSTLTLSENRGASRAGVVTFTQNDSRKIITITVQQAAGVITYGNWVVNVSASPTTISASGGTSVISASALRDVFTNGVKTSTETAVPGLAANGVGFSLSGTTLMASNNVGAARLCVVAASHGGVSSTCTVTQLAGVITYNYAFTLDNGSSTASWTGISSSGDARSYSIVSTRQVLVNGTYNRTENVGYSGTGNAWIGVSGSTITVLENMNTTPRGGNATFTQAESGKTISITILQLKKSSIDIN